MSDTATSLTTQVYKVYIRATPERIWEAITDPGWSVRYGYGGHAHYDLAPGGRFHVVPDEDFKAGHEAHSGEPCPDPIIDGEVLEADPPHRLVTTYRFLMDPAMAAEGFTRLTHEIEDLGNGSCSLTVVHDVEGAPTVAHIVSGAAEEHGAGGGWAWVLSDLKSLLETGEPLGR
jgi:uncharacterized protein YndB with AHSA1/START domain